MHLSTPRLKLSTLFSTIAYACFKHDSSSLGGLVFTHIPTPYYYGYYLNNINTLYWKTP
jgi:hypothetical protein